jgi:hypothetical protein
MKIDGKDVMPGYVYVAGDDYERDVLVLGREMANHVRAAKAEQRPMGVYEVSAPGSASMPWRLTRST